MLRFVQQMPVSIQEAWAFFSNPSNLQQITPPYMKMRVISTHHGATMYTGQIIEYRVRPLWNIPWYWMTEITHVREGVYFVDEQRYGPYSFWHHQHHFRPVAGGVEMTDIVHYKLPLGFLGDVVNGWWVLRQLEGIFEYRREKVGSLFGC